MRIIYAGTLIPHPGGSAMLGGDLVDGLARRGHDVVAVAPITAAALAQGDPLAGGGFRVLRYLVPGFESSPNHPPSDRFRNEERDGVAGHLVPLLEAGGVDLVIAGRETFATHVPALAHRFAVPCVILVQGATLWGLLDGTYSAGERRAILDGLGAADRVIAVARHLMPRLEALGLVRTTAIPNAVDPRAFAPGPRDPALMRAHDLRDADVIVAHVSNLKDLKRPLDVAQAAAAALRRDSRLRFLIVGDGPGRAQIETEAARLGIADCFRFSGWVPRAAVASYLRLADVVVMPSTAEALALAYLETQASGRVLIASDIAAAREVVEDGVTGLLFPVGDVEAMANCIVRAAADTSLRAAIGARARAFAEAHTFETALDAYERAFVKTIGRRA